MADKYRKLTTEELQNLGIKENKSQNNFIKDVIEHFDKGVYKILCGFNSEYNDEYYSLNGFSYIEVYDENDNLMVPKKNKIESWRTVLKTDYGLTDKDEDDEDYSEDGLVDYPDDIVIYVKGMPDLYVKE